MIEAAPFDLIAHAGLCLPLVNAHWTSFLKVRGIPRTLAVNGNPRNMWYDLSVSRLIDPKNLVGAHEIAERLDLSFASMVHTWRQRHKNFPQPIAKLSVGLIWDWTQVKEWHDSRQRMNG